MANVIKVEISANEIEITYSDGSREEIENGNYERKVASGRTVEERVATEADRARLEALASGADSNVEREYLLADGTKVEVSAGKIEVTHPDGREEEVEGGEYELKDSAGNTIEERPATAADIARLEAYVPTELAAETSDAANQKRSADPVTETGGSDDDRLRGDDGDDVLSGEGGNDRLRGREGDDTLSGGSGNDRLRGDEGADTIDGGAGNDRARGGKGDDTINGGDGNDRLRGDAGDDIVNGEAGNDRVRGGGGEDTVTGGDGDDIVRGDTGNDTVNGNAGDDRVRGGDGQDIITGGTGNDDLWGNSDPDIFVFATGDGADKIHDFETGLDQIDLSAHGIANFATLIASASDVGLDTVIDLGGGDSILIEDTSASDLSASDFVL